MDGEEKQRAKKNEAPYHAEAQRKAEGMVKALLSAIEDEPLPTERSLTEENAEMASIERRLAKLLTPLDDLETTVLSTKKKSKISQKKSKKKQKKIAL